MVSKGNLNFEYAIALPEDSLYPDGKRISFVALKDDKPKVFAEPMQEHEAMRSNPKGSRGGFRKHLTIPLQLRVFAKKCFSSAVLRLQPLKGPGDPSNYKTQHDFFTSIFLRL